MLSRQCSVPRLMLLLAQYVYTLHQQSSRHSLISAQPIMRLFSAPVLAVAAALFSQAHAKSSWSFKDAQLKIQGKGAGSEASTVTKDLSAASPVAGSLTLAPSDTLKLSLTLTSASRPSRPHQAFLTLSDPATALEDAFPLDVKESGKATLSLAHKDIPLQLLAAAALDARIVLGSFGSAAPLAAPVFTLAPAGNSDGTPSAAQTAVPAAPRYGKLPDLHHTFRDEPRSPPAFITILFAGAVFASLPVLLGVWLTLGANLAHLGEAIGKAPVAYAAFLGSVIGMEGVFAAYYVSWTLFQVLPAIAVLGVVGVVSGSRALTEVQDRRLAGKR
ncbi:hypothetical protein FH972_021227 [Carpinus fangiana]|uniref:Ribophorin II C-terminal domain-containing protein n=1 Tax=Carpinus fangiana TaxID=176857 RepID=A0A5N6KNQ9_9ROSI|nr:hypothetical protein FH972_021227 [Carpinus fangiana]